MSLEKRYLWSVFLLSLFCSVNAAIKIPGDATDDMSFTFTIGPHQHFYNVDSDMMYIGAGAAVANNSYSLARAKAEEADGSIPSFVPLAPTTVTLNGVAAQTNPILGKQITALTLFGKNPVVTISDEVTNIYLVHVEDSDSVSQIVSGQNINDAQGALTAGVIALSSGCVGSTKTQYMFAAVKANGGDFGDTGGGIAMLKETTTDISECTVRKITNDEGNEEEVQETQTVHRALLDILHAETGAAAGNEAAALDVTTDAIKITNDLASIRANAVDMYFDPDLHRLYVGLQVTSDSGAGDGARSVVVGRVENDTLIFNKIAPDAAITGEDKIIGAKGASKSVSVHKIRTLRTSTDLHYLIVEGGNGAFNATGNTVYALPLVNKLAAIDTVGNSAAADTAFTDPEHGALAKVDSDTVEKVSAITGDYLDRGFTTSAIEAADLFTITSTAAKVGTGALPLAASQVVTDLVAHHDMVLVSIGDAYDATTEAGAFASMAILDEQGRIKAWTPWRHVTGTDARLFGVDIVRGTGNYWLLTGAAQDLVYTVSATRWGANDNDGLFGGTTADARVGLSQQLAEEFPRATLGIHGLFDFPRTTPGFGTDVTTANNQLSMLVAVGGSKVVLVETGRNGSANIFRANSGDFETDKQTFTDGTLTGFSVTAGTKMLSISGGVLGTIGPITAAEVSRVALNAAETNGYLFVGGVGGLAVLSTAGNAGWDTSSPSGGLHARFDSLTSGMSFKLVGNYSFVRKLVSDGTYLYVLTHNRLDRITLSTIASGSPTIVTLASSETGLHASDDVVFSDFGVSNKFGLLATSMGLFRVGNGNDITSSGITDPKDLGWTEVVVPEGLGAASRFHFLSPTGHETGFASGGMVYVLNGFVGYNQARINRFSVADVSSSAIDNLTILPLPDKFLGSIPSFLYEFGSYRNFIAYDGLNLFNSQSMFQGSSPTLSSLVLDFAGGGLRKYAASLSTGRLIAHNNGAGAVKPFPGGDARTMRLLINDPASGGRLLAGDFGLMTNE